MHSTAPSDPPQAPEAEAEPTRRLRIFRPLATGGTGWRSVLREFAVVVTGVLCALAAQAWWEHRQERGRERDYLQQLLADTRENERRLDAAVAEDSVSGQALRRVVGALRTSTPLPPADTLLGWILDTGRASDVQPVTGTYQALLATGDLRLVRNDSLRARVVAYAAAMESESHRLRQLREANMSVAGPMGRSMPFLRGIFLGDVRARDEDFARMRDDPDAWAILLTQQASNVNRLSGLRRARRETIRMRAALEAEPLLRRRP